MITKSNINLYQISNLKSKILSDKGEIHKKTKLENDFVLSNANVYSEKGEIVKEAINPTDYDLNFYLRLKHIDPLYLITDFLNYHYNKTESKNKFLLHIEYEIISEYFKDIKHQKRIEFIKNWLNEKKHFTTPAIPKEWFALTTEEKYLYGFESYKRKFNNDDKDSFIEMESEHLKRGIHKFDKKDSLEPEELKTLIEFRKLLKYIQDKKQLEIYEKTPISSILDNDLKESVVYKFIDDVFGNQILKIFNSDNDYELFKNSIIEYFDSKGETVKPIQLTLKFKTAIRLYNIIHPILKKYQFNKTLKSHTGFYQICKGLSVYNNVTESDFFHRLSS